MERFKALTQPASCLYNLILLLFIQFPLLLLLLTKKRRDLVDEWMHISKQHVALQEKRLNQLSHSICCLWICQSTIKKSLTRYHKSMFLLFQVLLFFLNPQDPARYFPNCVSSSGGNLGTVCTSGLSATAHCSALACNAQCWIGQRQWYS